MQYSTNALILSPQKDNIFQVGEKIVVEIFFRNNCSGKYWPNQPYDKTSDLTLENRFAMGCILVESIFSSESESSSARMIFYCTKPGSQRIIIYHRGKMLGKPVPVTIISETLSHGKIVFLNGTVGTIDYPFIFRFIPYDVYSNIVKIPESTVRTVLDIKYPVAVDSNKNFGIAKESDGSFLISLETNKTGNYIIANKRLFLRYVRNGEYLFRIEPGKVYPPNSFARLIDPAKREVITGDVVVGTKLLLMVYLKDKADNAIQTDKTSEKLLNVDMNTNGVTSSLNLSAKNFLFYTYNFLMIKAGTTTLKVEYSRDNIVCQYCQFNILPEKSEFLQAQLYQYSNISNSFPEINEQQFTINKGDNFLFKLALKDKYNNSVPVVSDKGYSASLSGNNMDAIPLTWSLLDGGLKLEIPAGRLSEYINLVGLQNYSIEIVEIASNKSKIWFLSIISDGSDKGAGNGNYVAEKTNWFWLEPLLQSKYAVAGKTYRIAVQLLTNEGKRYSNWIDEEEILIDFKSLLPELKETLLGPRRTSITGTYTFTLSLRRGVLASRTIGFIVNDIKVAKTMTFYDFPAAAFKASISSKSLINDSHLKQGEINKAYSFDLLVTDRYDNPNDYSKGTSIIAIKTLDKNESFAPICNQVSIGSYTCETVIKNPGNYSVESSFFSNGPIPLYYVHFKTGKPSLLTTTATITNDISKGIKAGTAVNFVITVKDSSGNRIEKADLQNLLDTFELNLQEPSAISLTSIPLSNVNDNGEILTSFVLEKAGKNVFLPLFESKNIVCNSCSVDIISDDTKKVKILVYSLEGSTEVLIDTDSILSIDNSRKDPLFVIRFRDFFNNVFTPPTDSSFEAKLLVPGGARTFYNFEIKPWGPEAILIRLQDADYTYFKSELFNEEANLTIKSSSKSLSSMNLLLWLETTLKGVASDDNEYTNDDINKDNCDMSPKDIEITAGTWTDLKIELRATNNKLYNFPDTFGWYKNPSSSFKLVTSDGFSIIPGIKNGKQKGTYLLHFTCYKAYRNGVYVSVFYLNPKDNVNFTEITTKFKLTVFPANINYLIMNDTLIKDTVAGLDTFLSMKPYDLYRNLIYKVPVNSLNLQIKSNNTAEKAIIPMLTQNADAEVKATYKVLTPGLVNITSIKFRDQQTNKIVTSYSYMVNSSEIDASKSIAAVDKTSITAGNIIVWNIYAKDSYGNPLKCTEETIETLSAGRISPGLGQTIMITEKGKCSSEGDYCYWDLILKEQGIHEFKAFYKGSIIASTNNKVSVIASTADFNLSTLALFDSKTGNYEEYQTIFQQNIALLPEYKILAYDAYQNKLDLVPSEWTPTLFLSNDELKDSGISFCYSNPIFKMCTDNRLQPNLVLPEKRWGDLVVPKNYFLSLKNSDLTNDYVVALSGASDDSDASNLPIEVQNTLMTPLKLEIQANKSIDLQITIMTTDPKLRRNEWFDDINESLKLSFSKDDGEIQFSFTRGEKKGIYKCTILSTIAYTVDPNIISLSVNGVVVNRKPLLFVQPGSPAKFLPYDLNEQIFTPVISSGDVDSVYTQGFMTIDSWNNQINLNSDSLGANTLLYDPKNQIISHNRDFPISSDAMTISFSPQVAGDYKLKFNSETSVFVIKIAQGKINAIKSLGNVEPLEIVAGESVLVTLALRDQLGNDIIIDSSLLESNSFGYLLALPDDSVYSQGINPVKVENNTITFSQKLTVKGIYKFKVTVNSQPIDMSNSRINVSPSAPSLNNSILLYLEDETNRYLTADRETPIKEDNVKYDPIYSLILADEYNNEISIFSEQLVSQLTVILYGNDYAIEKPLHFSSNKTSGNSLEVTIESYDRTRYQAGTFETTPYTLAIYRNDTNESILYKVSLLGEGDSDKDAEIEKPLDLSQTYLDKTTLELVAGLADSFMIELRTASGKRKSDVGDIPVTLSFNDTGNYSYQVTPGDQKGRFVIRVSGTTANERSSPAIITVNVNKTAVIYTLDLIISPSNLDHLKSPTNFSNIIDADRDYSFLIIPLDKYENVANVKIIDLNLEVRFPSGSYPLKESFGYIEPSTGNANYIVKSRVAGEYLIQSQYLPATIKFSIIPGVVSEKYTKAIINPVSILAGESTFIDVYPADTYNNAISPIGDRQNECTTKISLSYLENGVLNRVVLLPNTANLTLFNALTLKKAGTVTILISVASKLTVCDSCQVEVLPNKASISNTKFFILKSDASESETNHPSTPYSAKDISLMAKLFDSFGNNVEIKEEETFKMTMQGNNMRPINLLVQKAENQSSVLFINVNQIDQEYFSNLVVAKNYNLTFFYLLNTKTIEEIDLSFDIEGIPDDSGNGDIDITKTNITPKNITLIAGVESTVSVEFRTNENKRYSGKIALSSLLAEQTVDSKGEEKLSLVWALADKTSRFSLILKGFEASLENEFKYIQVSLNSLIYDGLLTVNIDPNLPDPTKVEILQKLPFNVNGDKLFDIIIRLYDRYNNTYTKANWAPKVQGRISSGKGQFNATTFDPKNNAYIIPIIPIYPPRIMEVQLVFVDEKAVEFTLLDIPWTSQVLNELDLSKTEIQGNDLSGVPMGQDFSFFVLLKDVNGYCYESTKNITIALSGPYINNDLDSKAYVAGFTEVRFIQSAIAKTPTNEDPDIQSNGTSCLKYYEVDFYGNQIQKIGFYLIEVYYESHPISILRYKNAYMSPGPAFPSNSFLEMFSPKVYEETFQTLVYTFFSIRVSLMDSFKNQLETSNGSSVELGLPGYTSPNDFTLKTIPGAGFIDLELVVKKVGVLPGGALIINKKGFSFKQLSQKNFPDSITLIPGNCSNESPSLEIAALQLNQSIVSYKTFFKSNCLDQYGNKLSTGGDKFTAQIISEGDVANAQSINIPVTVVDNNDGSYRFDFTPAYSGLYKVVVQLNNQAYGSMFFFKVLAGQCPASQPLICLGSNKCVESYYACGYSILSCSKKETPIRCLVSGVSTCVKSQIECDCLLPYMEMKCNGDNKCVDVNYLDYMCSFKAQNSYLIDCPADFSYLCPDGSCRLNSKECPSQPVCPPLYRLCPDLSCVDKTKSCPDRGQICPDDRFYRCADFSCVSNYEDCPTRVTCPKASNLLCPDGSCTDGELLCKAPRKCETGLVLCSDNSCAKNYDNCPKGITCPIGQSLCTDGVCKNSCVGVVLTSLRVVRLLSMLEGNNTNTTDKDISSSCPANQTLCKGSNQCVDQPGQCPTSPFCKSNEVKCGEFSCSSSQKSCFTRSCPSSSFLCWDKTCVTDKSLCPTPIACPPKYPTLCSDGSCVNSSSQCQSSMQCPAYIPIRCGTGECKRSFEECATQTLCPTSNPLRCMDGSCVKDVSTCESIVERTKCLENQIRCGDGSCSATYSLCPSAVSCSPGQILCWNTICADSLADCDSLTGETVCDVEKIKCPDGSCANNLQDCPTGIICPFDKPIRCEDGNCKDTVEDCQRYTECPETYNICPDGTCQKGRCSSASVTCSSSSPYKCFDNTCRKNPFDCPSMPECPDSLPILCKEGVCVSERIDCPVAESCDLATPVRCPDGLCYSNSSECKELTTECPSNKRMCEDGACLLLTEVCPTAFCPKETPLKCQNGACVKNLTFCNNNETNCPFDSPYKCSNGQCTASKENCPQNIACSNNNTLCPDGTCRPYKNSCPLKNGCPLGRPLKCFSGNCVDPKIQSCSLAKCPKKQSFKCPNGLCMSKWNACPSIHTPISQNPCQSNPFNRNTLCGDGSCVSSLDECKPIYSCSRGETRCLDGSCKAKEGYCSLAPNSCPKEISFRCENGACVNSSLDCLNDEGCPNASPMKCGHYGLCARTHEECEELAEKQLLPNNCTLKRPIKCNGNCVSRVKECNPIAPKCNGSFECNDGTCQKNYSLCPKNCSQDQILCPNTKKCANSSNECILINNCPAKTPKKCADGSCINDFERCPASIICPLFKPYLCADLECVGEPTQCSVLPACPSNRSFRCTDLSCVSNQTQCLSEFCPPTNIIRCPTGDCVDSVDECRNSPVSTICTTQKPYLCSNSECVSSPGLCIISTSITNRRLLETTSSNNTTIDQGCDISLPKLCSDGSCRSSYSDCELIKGCFEPALSYRCRSGQCVSSIEDCIDDNTIPNCSNNTHRCEDGICRTECPEYDGCSLNTPIQCPNGFCVKDSTKCLKNSQKLVCVDNSAGNCQRPKRSYQSEKLAVTISKYLTSTIGFVSDASSNVKIANLVIPANAFRAENSTDNSPYNLLHIRPVAWSSVNETINGFINKKIMNYLFKESEKLTSEQFIRSSIFAISIDNFSNELFYRALNLTMTIDPLEGLSANSYCLGYLLPNSSNWACEDNYNSSLNEKNQIEFTIQREGTFAVIMALKENSFIETAVKEDIYCDWWCSNGNAVNGAIIGVLIGGLIFGIFFFGYTRHATSIKKKEGFNEDLIAKNENMGEGKKRIEEVNQSLQQKDKILEETKNEEMMAKEQNESLMKQLENLKNEIASLQNA